MNLSLKEILFVLFNVAKDVTTNAFVPLVVTLVKTSIIAFVIYCLFHYAGHNIECVRDLNFTSCLVIVTVVRLLRFNYDDFNEEAEEIGHPLDTVTPEYLKDEPVNQPEEPQMELLQEVQVPPSNIRKNIEANESTRE